MKTEELLNEAQEVRQGMSAKEMREWIFDRVWVLNKEVGILWGKVDLVIKIALAILGVLLAIAAKVYTG